MPFTKTCLQCGQTFVSHLKAQKFCSRECYQASRRISVRKTCLQCGETFQVVPSKLDRKFCSRKCFLEFWRARKADSSRTCPICNRPFIPSHKRAKFCSQNCFNQFQRSGRITVTCSYCGRTFQDAPSRDRKFCNLECYKQALRQLPPRKADQVCQNCGQPFAMPAGKRQKFCSKNCYDQFQRSGRVTITCLNCGRRFQVQPSQEHRKFCSRECFVEARRKAAMARSAQRPCLNCGQPLSRRKRKFCSQDCRRQFHRARRVTKTCSYCGKAYEVIPSYADRSKFCSQECFNRSRATRPRGYYRRSNTAKISFRCAFCKR